MFPLIDKEETGRRIRMLLENQGLTVQDVREFLCLGCVQSVYHWLEGQSLPSLDNLYALSDLLQVPMDTMVAGSRRERWQKGFRVKRPYLRVYYILMCCRVAA